LAHRRCRPHGGAPVAQNPIGSVADGQTITLTTESAPGFRFTLTETTQIESIEMTLTQSSGAFAVVFVQTIDGTSFPDGTMIHPMNPMLMNPGDVVVFDPENISGPTNVTIPYPTVLAPGEYVLSFNVTAPTSTHTFVAHEAAAGSEGVQWTPIYLVDGVSYNLIAWSDTTLQPDIRINGTVVIPEPSVFFLTPVLAGLLIHRRKRAA